MTRDLPPPELLRKLLRYEPETGKLFWRKRSIDFFTDGKRHSAAGRMAIWNGRHAGKEAFSLINKYGYCTGRIFGIAYRAHRVAWAMHYGKWPDKNIDHINGMPDDNRITNLRDVSQSVNLRNARMPSNNKSGVCGVQWSDKMNKWRAQIRMHGKTHHLGVFDTIEAASAARESANAKHGFTERHGRKTT